MTEIPVVKVKRDGPRGWHWINQSSFDPSKHELYSEKPALRQDGPTVAEFVTAGYLAVNYPPHGYASRSSDDEIAAAIAAQQGGPAVVEIPAEWEGLHWKQQVSLAEKISGRDDIAKAEEAREIIAAEVARRAAA